MTPAKTVFLDEMVPRQRLDETMIFGSAGPDLTHLAFGERLKRIGKSKKIRIKNMKCRLAASSKKGS